MSVVDKLIKPNDVVSFDAKVPVNNPNGRPIPNVHVGYRGKRRAFLFQYLPNNDGNSRPHPNGLVDGDWYAMAFDEGNPDFQQEVNTITPMGMALEELKEKIAPIIRKHFQDADNRILITN